MIFKIQARCHIYSNKPELSLSNVTEKQLPTRGRLKMMLMEATGVKTTWELTMIQRKGRDNVSLGV